jgi:hypothetical protein
MILSLLLLNPMSVANAADITNQPDALKADVSLTTDFRRQNFGLDEQGEDVGGVTINQQQVGLRAEVGLVTGVSAFLAFSGSTGHEFQYTNPRTMGWDPKADEGSLRNGLPVEDGVDAVTGSGMLGVWMGLRGTPFSENRGAKTTWLLEGALRTPDGTNIYNGTGAGDGGSALRLASIFSTTRGITHPYISAVFTNSKAFSTTLEGDTEIEFKPANTIDMTAGAEFDTWGDAATGRSLSLEGRMFFNYTAPALIPTGLYLAEVLPGTENSPITSAEYSSFGTGFALHYRPIREMQIDMNVDIAWPTPHRLEHPYPVTTSIGSSLLSAGLSVTYLYR